MGFTFTYSKIRPNLGKVISRGLSTSILLYEGAISLSSDLQVTKNLLGKVNKSE